MFFVRLNTIDRILKDSQVAKLCNAVRSTLIHYYHDPEQDKVSTHTIIYAPNIDCKIQ